MPSINRIRVNNVKYNFGTQQYDDFVMRMYGKNTLYDLANGGGKSVLMLLLLQNLIPNCTLDEKQPIEKLFRNGCGNTVIHSLIEWKLDDEDVEGYRYMTTGFCARKAKDQEEGQEPEKKDTASVEYFNYCIKYREYNRNDIVNLPLSNQGEHISFSGLRSYLKDLSRKDFNLDIHVFDRKGEYQRYISQYGLYESHWEIIRGINKTEGHVRTYFETNYKTARKVVEDLLIEEIIEKAYLVKTEQSEDSADMAKNLLDIKDKLMELTKKKRDIANYDRQTELMHVLEGRVTSFLNLFEQRDKLTRTIANVYVTGKAVTQEDAIRLENFQKQKEDKLLEKERKQKELASLKVRKLEYEKEALMEEIESLLRLVGENKAEYQEAQNELKLKESMNDYMEYKKDAAAKYENESVLKAAQTDSRTDVTKLRQLAYSRKCKDDELNAVDGEALEKERGVLDTLSETLAAQTAQLSEAQIDLSVAKNDVKRCKEEARELLATISRLKANTSILMLADAEELLAANEKEVQACREQIAKLESQKETHTREYYDALHAKDTATLQWQQAKQEQEAQQAQLDKYLDNADRIQNMMRIYNVSEQKELLSAINKRCMQCIVDVTNKQEQLKTLAKRRQELSEERMIGETPAVSRVKEYIETRHNVTAVLGMDYLAARDTAQREQLLTGYPLLPYGVVVKDFDFLATDDAIYSLQLGDYAVPLFSEALLYNPMGRNHDDSVIFISKGKEQFTDKKLIQAAQKKLDEEIQECESAIRRLTQMGLTYEEDMEYISSLGASVSIQTMDMVNEKKAQVLSLEKQCESYQETCHDLLLAIDQDETARKEAGKTLDKLLLAEKNLVAVQVVSDRIVKLDEEKNQRELDSRRLAESETVLTRQIEENRLAMEDVSGRIRMLEETMQAREATWKQLYADYYVEGDYERLSLSDDELTAVFKAAKAVYERENIVLEDKKQLIATLQQSMKRSLRSIERRGIALERLEQMDAAHQLYTIGEQALNKLSVYAAKLSTDGAVLQNQLEQKRSMLHHLEGNIEQAVKQIEEKYKGYTPESVSQAEIEQAIAEGDRLVKGIDQEYKEMVKAYERSVKQHNSMVELYKDVARIMKVNAISPKDAVVLHESEEGMRRLFEESLLAYDKSEKALERAKAELLKYKSHTADTLYQMQAFELSETIGRDVAVPEDYGEATRLLENLKAMISFLALEKERVAKGISDMEFIKRNFENQCIQRCKDVKTELDKLPVLSRIMVDNEPVQMVGLSIPYVKEEFMKQKMSEYIDDVVAGADRYDDARERMKYIRSRLVLKKLFGVIVTDMNAIKLTLYKRERIKEQSRYLRYEEAVGSTGQSQGIYIQFLISVIHYISGMYGVSAENDKRTKTIFIDNPFGAAKDIYIWEPIFALLQANHVQLVVPARGATPAITARFDVNYTLGQQLVGKKQQTVVIDYRSQTKQDEIEYKELDYEQASFDFI